MPSTYSMIVLALCCLQATLARPTKTKRDAKPWGDFPDIFHMFGGSDSSSFSSLSSVFESCSSYDLGQAELPTAPTPLPKPSGSLAHVAIGRGFQNYTCDLSNSTAVPYPIGAIATLYNASCVAARSPTFLNYLPNLAYALRWKTLPDFHSIGSSTTDGDTTNSLVSTLISNFQQSTPQNYVLNAANELMSGHHFFTDDTSPRFDLNTDNGQLGCVTVSKVGVSDAPSDATPGSVSWLYLPKSSAYSATPQAYSAVYRVNTVGGAAPSTCKEAGEKSFRIAYAAQYWFYR